MKSAAIFQCSLILSVIFVNNCQCNSTSTNNGSTSTSTTIETNNSSTVSYNPNHIITDIEFNEPPDSWNLQPSQASTPSTTTIITTNCSKECQRCSPFKGCTKCPYLIVHKTRQCVTVCPFGYNRRRSTFTDYIGFICVHNGNFLGLTSNTLAILTGVLTGCLLCTIFLIGAVFYVKYRRKYVNGLNSETSSESGDSPERRDFLKQLETLRPYAQTYLDMLNDTRRQMRQLHAEGDNSALAAYKPVVRDLAKILLLLNRRPEAMQVPEDWEHLFSWAEKALKRYKRMSDTSQPQVAQLINFLQADLPLESDMDSPNYSVRGSTTMSTFKPDGVGFGSNNSLQHVAVENFNRNYDSKLHLNPQWRFEYSLVPPAAPSDGERSLAEQQRNVSEFDAQQWRSSGSKEYLSGSLLYLGDDFSQLGFRPQDVITTEL